MNEIAGRNAAGDLSPGLAVVVGAEHVWFTIIHLIALGAEVSGAGFVSRGVDDADACEFRQALGRDVGPILAAVASDVGEAVIGAGPYRVGVKLGGCDGEDRGIDFGAILVFGDGSTRVAESFWIGAREVGADAFPILAVVESAPQVL